MGFVALKINLLSNMHVSPFSVPEMGVHFEAHEFTSSKSHLQTCHQEIAKESKRKGLEDWFPSF